LFFADGRRPPIHPSSIDVAAGAIDAGRCWCLITPPLLMFLLKLPSPGLIANWWRTVVHASVTFGETWKCSAYYKRENVSLYKQYFENRMW